MNTSSYFVVFASLLVVASAVRYTPSGGWVDLTGEDTYEQASDMCCYGFAYGQLTTGIQDYLTNSTRIEEAPYSYVEASVCDKDTGVYGTRQAADISDPQDGCNKRNNGNRKWAFSNYDVDIRRAGPTAQFFDAGVSTDPSRTVLFNSSTGYTAQAGGCQRRCNWCGACGTADALARIPPEYHNELPYTMHDMLFWTDLQQFQLWYEMRCEAENQSRTNNFNFTELRLKNLNTYAEPIICGDGNGNKACKPGPFPGTCTYQWCPLDTYPILCDTSVTDATAIEQALARANKNFSYHICGMKSITERCDDLNDDPDCILRYTGSHLDGRKGFSCNRFISETCTITKFPETSTIAGLSSSQSVAAAVVGAAAMAALVGMFVGIRVIRRRRAGYALSSSASVESVELGLTSSPSGESSL